MGTNDRASQAERQDAHPNDAMVPFELLMSAVAETVRQIEQQHDQRDALTTIADAEAAFTKASNVSTEGGFDVPPQVVADFQVLMGRLRTLASVQHASLSGLDSTVAYLLWRNYKHMKATVGAQAAAQALRNSLKEIAPTKRRGRPSVLSPGQLMKARGLKKQKKSYAQIARTLNTTRERVRTALRTAWKKPK